jgi:CBS domain-containing protein
MDGGRVLRALLAMRMEYTRATQVAAHLGQGIALLFGFLGLLWNPFLVFIAFFVWIGAAQEASMVLMKSALAGIPVERAMLTDFRTLFSSDALGRAVDLVLAGSQHDFPVLDGGRLAGVLRREDLLRGLQEGGRDSLVGDAMRCDFQTAESSEMLETAFARLQGCDCRVLPVLRGGALAGLLTPDNVGELLAIRSALGGGSRGAGERLLAASR